MNRNGSGGILVRFETLDGMVKWRNMRDLSHRSLCRAGGLAEAITWFDVASGFDAGGGVGRRGRKIDGLIFQGPKGSPPIGKITLVQEDEKFKDEDHVAMLRALGCDLKYA